MKKKLHLKLWSLLLMLMTTLVSAQTFTVNHLRYTVSSGLNVTVVGFDSEPTGPLTIPDTVSNEGNLYSVTSIGDGAFYNCSGLTSVNIPNSVTSIGNGAFKNCSGLTSLSIPTSVTSINTSTFSNCSGLTSLVIPNSVKSIGTDSFSNCSGLTSLNIPNSVESIDIVSFSNCSGLTSLDIPNSVKSIGTSSFSNCSGLISLNIPNSVTSIGFGAFSNCSGLKFVNVSWATPLVINSNVFSGLSLNTIVLNVSLPGNVDDYKTTNIWKDFSPINATLSTPSYLLNNNIVVYPTLAKDFIYVSGLSQRVSYTIFSLLGLKVGNGTVSDNGKIEVQNLTNGVYILQLEGSHTVRFIKE